jgi:hypothetical protein
MSRHEYRLTIATETGLTDDESQRSLRAMLKLMLRAYGIRCLTVEPSQDTPQQPLEPNPDK